MLKRRDAEVQTDPQNPETAQNPPKPEKKQKKYSVAIYVSVMFVFVVLLIVLSYLIQQRDTQRTISDITEQHSDFSIEALRNIDALQKDNISLRSEVETLEEEIAVLQESIDEHETEYAELEAEHTELLETQAILIFLIDGFSAASAGNLDSAKDAAWKLGQMENTLGEYTERYNELLALIELLETPETPDDGE